MRSQRKNPTATNRRSGRPHSGGGAGLQDASSDKLAKLSRQGGNENLRQQLSSTEGRRDDLLQHIIERLKVVHEIQALELETGRDERKWFREVAKGEAGHHLPDATRWHDATRFYMDAAHALCAGNLGRGVSLLEQAQEAERAALESCPDMVMQKVMPARRKAPEELPEAGIDVSSGASCPTTSRPIDLKFGEEVLDIIEEVRDAPSLKRTKAGNWWETLEEEEDEEAEA
jgi:hypothetical protein